MEFLKSLQIFYLDNSSLINGISIFLSGYILSWLGNHLIHARNRNQKDLDLLRNYFIDLISILDKMYECTEILNDITITDEARIKYEKRYIVQKIRYWNLLNLLAFSITSCKFTSTTRNFFIKQLWRELFTLEDDNAITHPLIEYFNSTKDYQLSELKFFKKKYKKFNPSLNLHSK
jgi:hypothetical protein